MTKDDVNLLSAVRLPKGKNSTKPAPIKLRFLTPADVHLVLESLHLLKGVRECKGIHIERDVPMMLNEQRKKGNAIVWQYRLTHGKDYQGRIWYPGNRVQVAMRKRGEDTYKDLTKDEMEELYAKSKRSSNWADDDDAEGASGGRRGRSGSIRQRSTPGEDSRSKKTKFSDHLFD